MSRRFKQEDIELLQANMRRCFGNHYDELDNMILNLKIVTGVERLTAEGVTTEIALQRTVERLGREGKGLTLEAAKRRYYRMLRDSDT